MRNARALGSAAFLVALAGCNARPVPGEPGTVYEVPTGDPGGGAGGTARIDSSGCTRCHGDAARDNLNADPLVAAAPPLTPTGGGDADPATGAHLEHLGDGNLHRWFECASCHLVPTSFPHLEQLMGKVTFSRRASTDWNGGLVDPAPTWNPATRTCTSTYCHGNFPNGNRSNVVSWSGSAGCGSCHGLPPGGSHPSIGGQGCDTCHGAGYASGVDPDLHVNGRVDGGGEPENGGVSCGGCHGSILSAMGDAGRSSRHALGSVAGTNDSPADSGIAWTSPLSSNGPDQRSCVNMCHGDHPHDLTSPATGTHESNAYADASSSATRASGSASRVGAGGVGGPQNRTKTDFEAGQANGGMCTSCHRNPVDAARPAVDPAAFDASAHDGTRTAAATTYDWSYRLHDGGLFARNCTKCHASNTEGRTPAANAGGPAVHFGENASILSGTKRPGGTVAGFVCYNCHGSMASPGAGAQGNRSGKDIQSQIDHATASGQSGHPAISDAVHDTVSEQTNAAFGNALGSTGRHASCLDCHHPHEAKKGTHVQLTNAAGPALEGAWGAKLSTNPGFWTAPTGLSFTQTTIAAGTEPEATLCFKCHSAYYWGTGTPPTSPGLAAAQTDVAKELNPNNTGNYSGGTSAGWETGESAGSFHPVLASAGNNLGVTNNIKSPWTKTSLMTCSDCHGSDQQTDPSGPHGSAAKFVLKGPNTAWSSSLCNTSAGMPNGTFCINCHNQNYSGGRFPYHTSQSKHYNRNGTCDVKCFHCHTAIPHGSPRPGLLVTVGRSTNVPGAYPGFDGTAPYYQAPNTTYGLYVYTYPASQASTWDQNNCGCGTGGSH